MRLSKIVKKRIGNIMCNKSCYGNLKWNLKKFSELTFIKISTLRRWKKLSKLIPFKDENNKDYYSFEHIRIIKKSYRITKRGKYKKTKWRRKSKKRWTWKRKQRFKYSYDGRSGQRIKSIKEVFNKLHPGLYEGMLVDRFLNQVTLMYILEQKLNYEQLSDVIGCYNARYLRKRFNILQNKSYKNVGYNKYYRRYKIEFPETMIDFIQKKSLKNNIIMHYETIKYILYCYFFEVLNMLRQDISFKFKDYFAFNVVSKDKVLENNGLKEILYDYKTIEFYKKVNVTAFINKMLNNDNEKYLKRGENIKNGMKNMKKDENSSKIVLNNSFDKFMEFLNLES